MYSTVTWVPKGYSAHKPIRAVPTQAEMEEYKKMLSEQDQLDAAREKEEFGEEEDDGMQIPLGGIGADLPEDVVDPSKDPNIAVKEDEFDSDEEDDLDILPTDCILLAAKSDETQSSLEVHVYDETTGNFYLHHDILLAAYPLCLTWLDCYPHPADDSNGHPSGSYVAVGTFRPEIEIWDTNVIDSMEPDCVLGGQVKGKKRTLKPGSHRQAVMGLSWNRDYRNILASSSADTTVKLWDITTQHCLMTLNHHKDKVPVVQFHPVEGNVFLTASYDCVCAVTDGRAPNNGTWIGIPAKPESACWNPAAPYSFYVTTEEGEMLCFDVRNTQSPAVKQTLHSGPCTALSVNPANPALVATSGEDGLVRLWERKEREMRLVAERNVNLGNVFSTSFFESNPYLLAACGSSQDLCIWDVREVEELKPIFEKETKAVTEEKMQFEASENTTGSLEDIARRRNKKN